MACQQFLIEGIHCGIDGGGLNKHIVAVCVILNHSLDATHLSFNAFKAVKKRFFVLFVPYGMLFTTRTDFFDRSFIFDFIFTLSVTSEFLL